MIYTLAADKVTEVKARLGKRVEGMVEVVEGLKAGDTVVTAGNAQLADGAKVEVVSPAAAAGE
jgi:membrane fusion protein (multidrug efflux system)